MHTHAPNFIIYVYCCCFLAFMSVCIPQQHLFPSDPSVILQYWHLGNLVVITSPVVSVFLNEWVGNLILKTLVSLEWKSAGMNIYPINSHPCAIHALAWCLTRLLLNVKCLLVCMLIIQPVCPLGNWGSAYFYPKVFLNLPSGINKVACYLLGHKWALEPLASAVLQVLEQFRCVK